MPDIINQPIEVNDIVCFISGSILKVGTIKKITPTGATITSSTDTKGSYKHKSKFVKITSQYTTFKQEHPEHFL